MCVPSHSESNAPTLPPNISNPSSSSSTMPSDTTPANQVVASENCTTTGSSSSPPRDKTPPSLVVAGENCTTTSSSPLPPPMPSDVTPPSQAAAGNNATMTSSVLSSPPATDTALGEQGKRVQPRRINPLADLLIPSPLIQVPIEASAAPTNKAKVSGKLMVASSTVLSARNLFAVDYLKEHSPTISEFKTIWDNTPSETKKKYEALSKERKAASRLAATARHSNVAD